MYDASSTPPIGSTAARILEREPSRSMPISRLYRTLTRELGPVLPDASALEQWLRDHGGRFAVLAAPGFSWAGPGVIRERHAECAYALENVGVPVEPRVALAAGPDRAGGIERSGDLLGRLDASILRLSDGPPADPTLSADLAEAVARARELRRAVARGD